MLILIAFLLAQPVSRAATTELSFARCLEVAESRSPQVVQGILGESRARSAYEELARRRLPQLSAVASLSVSDDVATQLPDANKAAVRIEQTGFPFSSSWIKADQRERELRAASFFRIESQMDVALLVKQLYFSILKGQDAIVHSRRVEEQLQGLLGSIIPKFTLGRSQPFDQVKVGVSLSDLARTRELGEAQLAFDQSQLAQVLGLTLDEPFVLSPVTRRPEIALPVQQPAPFLGSENPTLRALGEQVHAAELGISAARYARVPSIVSAFEYGYAGQTLKTLSLGWDFSLAVKVPLFDWGLIASQISQERTLHALAENKLQLESLRIRSELAQVRAQARAHGADQERLQPLLTETHRAAVLSIDRYKKGGLGILETTDAIGLWVQTLLNERSAFYSYLSDLAKIDRLQGTRNYENL